MKLTQHEIPGAVGDEQPIRPIEETPLFATDPNTNYREAVALLEANILAALDALNFDAGNWNDPERHLRDQIEIAKQHLLLNVAPPCEQFSVIAGKYDDYYDNGRNIKYASAPYTSLKTAIDDYQAHESYPFCYIEFDGYLLTAMEGEA